MYKQQEKMEKRINKKIESYISDFKENIRNKTNELEIPNEKKNEFLQYIYDYMQIDLKKDDFTKRKRVKNVVPHFDRCCAKRANNEQCTRRRKEGFEYCGTHTKGIPHGVLDKENENSEMNVKKIEVWAQDIQGIIYYIDKDKNVYKTEDILGNKINPKIVAKYVQNGETYSIPEFEI